MLISFLSHASLAFHWNCRAGNKCGAGHPAHETLDQQKHMQRSRTVGGGAVVQEHFQSLGAADFRRGEHGARAGEAGGIRLVRRVALRVADSQPSGCAVLSRRGERPQAPRARAHQDRREHLKVLVLNAERRNRHLDGAEADVILFWRTPHAAVRGGVIQISRRAVCPCWRWRKRPRISGLVLQRRRAVSFRDCRTCVMTFVPGRPLSRNTRSSSTCAHGSQKKVYHSQRVCQATLSFWAVRLTVTSRRLGSLHEKSADTRLPLLDHLEHLLLDEIERAFRPFYLLQLRDRLSQVGGETQE